MASYEEFVEKFKPKLTTDDCMTPPEVYDTVRDWVCEEYGIDQAGIIRPFWPGEDYQTQDYPEGCVVLDNPPFSILSTIIAWYQERGIRFFLFAPTLTAFSGRKNLMDVNHIVCDCDIEYENGAIVHTSFVSNLTRGIVAQRSLPTRGAWIEIVRAGRKKWGLKLSLPTRGAWIEIPKITTMLGKGAVAPHAGSVDRNDKCVLYRNAAALSLPTRGAWIEMA